MPAKKKTQSKMSVEEAKEPEPAELACSEEVTYWQSVAKPQWQRELTLLLAKPLPVAAFTPPPLVLPVSTDRLEYELGVCKLIAPYIEGFQGPQADLEAILDWPLDFDLLQKDLRLLLRLVAQEVDFVPALGVKCWQVRNLNLVNDRKLRQAMEQARLDRLAQTRKVSLLQKLIFLAENMRYKTCVSEIV
jgi:hypothetical protein